MLSAIRGTLGSFVVLTLLGLLIASFALWGIPDLFSSIGGRAVAEVDGESIDAVDYDRAFRQRLRQLEAQLGQPIDREQAVSFGIPQQVLQQQITALAFDIHARDMGLRASNKQVISTLQGIEAFEGFDGNFDRQAYENQLRLAGITPSEFESELRREIVRRQLVETLTAEGPSTNALAKELFRYRQEGRKATILSLSAEDIESVEEPSEEDLQAAYEFEKAQFMTPEYRQVAILEISPSAIANPDAVTQEQLETAYQDRLAEFQTPELRNIDIVTFDVNAKGEAERFIERVDAGEAFADVVADTTDFTAEEISLGDVSETDLAQDYNEKVAATVFAAEEGGLSAPAQSVFGWHIFRIKSVTPPFNRSLDQVAGRLRNDVAEEQALDRVYDISVEAEDALSRGAGLREIAQDLGLELIEATVSRDGELQSGGAADDVVIRHLPKIWNFVLGEPALLEATDDGGFVMVDVLDVIKPQQKPFEDVRGQLLDKLIFEKKLAVVGERADAMSQALEDGKAAEDAAAEFGASHVATDWIIRSRVERGDVVAPNVGRLAFQLEPGEIAVERSASGDGYVVVRLDDVREGEPNEESAAFTQLSAQLKDALLNDALVQYELSLRDALGVTINTELVQQIIQPQDGF